MRMRAAFRFSISPPQLKHHRGRFFSAASTASYSPLINHRYWSGLPCWRRSPINNERYWGPNGPIQEPSETQVIPADIGSCSSLAEMGSVVLSTADPLAKAKLSHLAYSKWRREGLPVGVSDAPSSPARPCKPQLSYLSSQWLRCLVLFLEDSLKHQEKFVYYFNICCGLDKFGAFPQIPPWLQFLRGYNLRNMAQLNSSAFSISEVSRRKKYIKRRNAPWVATETASLYSYKSKVCVQLTPIPQPVGNILERMRIGISLSLFFVHLSCKMNWRRNSVQVSPKEIPSPKNSGLPLNAYMLHNLAHVELNAIDLAWDTVVRFSPHTELLGEEFFADFAHVADDESRHFTWCSQRLGELGFRYGDMPAHSFLWRECEKSSDNVSARLAVIPLVQEARGLDAGPRLVNKLIGFGDQRTSNIVAKIADEEVAHVAVGVYWFVSVCQKMGREPDSTFRDILKEYKVELKGPFNYSARAEAGIPRDWYDNSTSTVRQENNLSEVYDRLACIVAMEQENSSMGKST